MLPAAAAVLLFSVAADDAKPPATPAQRLAALKAENEAAHVAYGKAGRELPDTPEGLKKFGELSKAFDKSQAARFSEALEIAESDPKSEAALAALEWVLTIQRSHFLPIGRPAVQLAAEHHADNPKVGRIVAYLGHLMQNQTEEFGIAATGLIRAVAEKNPDRAARGQAVGALAMLAKRRFDTAENRKAADTEALAAAAEKALEAVLKDYADCPRQIREGKRTLGDDAKMELFELRNLRIGKVAPEIEGEDTDGVRFKLSDSKGKVRVVNFWAGWCDPCMALVPHERTLGEKYKGKPFAIIGVNADFERGTAKAVAAENGMTWRSFWAGPKGPEGPICQTWNVRGWPTIYVLDGEGVIRAKRVRGPSMEAVLDDLLGVAKK